MANLFLKSGNATAMTLDSSQDITINAGGLTLPAAEKLILDGGASDHTYITESTNDGLDIVVGNVKGATITNTYFEVGPGSADVDFRVETQGGASSLFVEGSSGAVSIEHGNLWVYGSMSAGAVIDRTPYPESTEKAWNVINSHEKLPDGEYDPDDKENQLDHSKLNSYVGIQDSKGTDARDMSAALSCTIEALKDVSARLISLETYTIINN